MSENHPPWDHDAPVPDGDGQSWTTQTKLTPNKASRVLGGASAFFAVLSVLPMVVPGLRDFFDAATLVAGLSAIVSGALSRWIGGREGLSASLAKFGITIGLIAVALYILPWGMIPG